MINVFTISTGRECDLRVLYSAKTGMLRLAIRVGGLFLAFTFLIYLRLKIKLNDFKAATRNRNVSPPHRILQHTRKAVNIIDRHKLLGRELQRYSYAHHEPNHYLSQSS